MQLPPWAPVLSDGTVTLRAHRDDDIDGVVDQCSDLEHQRWTTVQIPYQRSHAQEYVRSRQAEWDAGRYLGFAVEVAGRFAGTVDLRPDQAEPNETRAADLGFGLGSWARGRGTTARALRLLLAWAFDELNLEVVHWTAIAGNWASRRVAWSVGFRVEGTVRGLLADRGTRADGWIGSLCAGDRLEPAHPWHLPPVLRGPTAVLRPHRPADAAAMALACNDPVTQHWLPHLPTPYTETDARAHLEQIAEEHAAGSGIYWAVTAPGRDEQLLGEIGVFGLARGMSRVGELGYWSHPSVRGRGLIGDAARLAARHALMPVDVGGLGLRRAVVRAAEGNHASQRVALSAGFRRAGLDRQAELLRDGTVLDLHRFDVVDGDL